MIRQMKVLYGAVRYGTAGRIDEKVRKQQNSKLPAVPYCKVKHHAVQSVKEEAAEARSEQSRAEATANTKQASQPGAGNQPNTAKTQTQTSSQEMQPHSRCCIPRHDWPPRISFKFAKVLLLSLMLELNQLHLKCKCHAQAIHHVFFSPVNSHRLLFLLLLFCS